MVVRGTLFLGFEISNLLCEQKVIVGVFSLLFWNVRYVGFLILLLLFLISSRFSLGFIFNVSLLVVLLLWLNVPDTKSVMVLLLKSLELFLLLYLLRSRCQYWISWSLLLYFYLYFYLLDSLLYKKSVIFLDSSW